MAEEINKTDQEKYYELIVGQLHGENSEYENALIFDWVSENEANKRFYEKAVKAWELSGNASKDLVIDTDLAWKKMKGKIAQVVPPTDTKIVAMQTQSISNHIWKIAAAFLLLIGAAYLIKLVVLDKPNFKVISTLSEDTLLILPDSSKVWLNKNSRISYDQDFNETERKVFLEGEAFFDVRKVFGKTFSVTGNRSITTVLGTSFNLRCYQKEKTESVQVKTGKVSFVYINDARNQKTFLMPGDKGILDSNNLISTQKIDDPNFIAWKENRLEFENTSLSMVVKTLQSYFDTKVEVTDPLLLDCRFTGSFENPKVDEIMTILSISTNSSFRKEENKYVLYGKGCGKYNP